MNCKTKIPEQIDTLIIPIDESVQIDLLQTELKKYGISLNQSAIEDINGRKDELRWWYGEMNQTQFKICIIGLGELPNYGSCVSVLKKFRKNQSDRLGKQVSLSINFLSNKMPEIIEGLANGWVQGSYDIGLYKTDKTELTTIEISFVGTEMAEQNLVSAAERGEKIGRTQVSVFSLVNAPSNRKTPIELADWAKKSAEQNGYTCTILEKPELETLGMHSLLAVNRGSEIPAKCIVMEYTPATYSKTIAIVGKGVTFDTGGLSIKGSTNMHYMKSDMGGAAATLGALEAIAKLKLPVRVIGIIPTTDNSVDAMAIKPGDVIESYSGKTIEVIDTDAEGRLVLADGLAYVEKNYQPDHMIDVATLTGSIIRAIGVDTAGLFTKNNDLAHAIEQAGEATGEWVWRMPMWDRFSDYMQSDIADIRNLSTKPIGGSITAAKFLELFTNEHKSWAHLDIAGPAFGANPLSKGYSATGFGVRLLVDTIERLQQ